MSDCSLASSTKNSEADNCYACGVEGHSTKNCPGRGLRKKEATGKSLYPFATCFVCKEIGHISRECPKNARGIYPFGGGCKFCGSNMHMAKDCKPTKNAGATILLNLHAIHFI
jgi:hypothetical protein